MSSSSQTITESGNRQNIFPIESQPELIENYSGYAEDAEKINSVGQAVDYINKIK